MMDYPRTHKLQTPKCISPPSSKLCHEVSLLKELLPLGKWPRLRAMALGRNQAMDESEGHEEQSYSSFLPRRI